MKNKYSIQEVEKIIKIYKNKLIELSQKTYSKYSNFRVASILVTTKKEYYGINIENRSFGLTICAERVAIFQAVLNNDFTFKYLLIFSPDSEIPLPPCGACRQVISEFSDNILIIMLSKNFNYKVTNINELYPADSLHDLKKN